MSPRRSASSRKQKRKSGLPTWVILAGAAGVVIIALGAALVIGNSQPPTPLPTVITSSGIPSSGRTLGDPNAPVTLVDFSDFQ